MSGPFKMKYIGKNKSAFPFKENPLKMYGGMKASPARSWWSKIKNATASMAQKVKSAFSGGGESSGEGGEGGGFGGLMGMGRGGGGFNKMHDQAHAGEGMQDGEGELGEQVAMGPQKWNGMGGGQMGMLGGIMELLKKNDRV